MENSNVIRGYKLILGYMGIIICMIGIILMIPIIIIPFFPEEIIYAKNFIIPSVISLLIGYLLAFTFASKTKGRLENHQDLILVVLIWVTATLISSVPFLLLGKYSFTHSIFEATSGYSTTGLSIVDVEHTPHIYLFFRSLMQFFGGVGLVLVVTSVLSDKFSMKLYHAEGHTDKLLPNLKKSARVILSIYLGYILIGSLAYWMMGMSFFDAINHSISAVSTGGFSTRTASIGYYDSLGIEIVTMILMLLGSTNFIIHLFLFKGQIKNILRHSETKFLIGALIIGIGLFSLLYYIQSPEGIGNAIRFGTFQFITALTTSGYQTISDFRTLSSILFGFVILLMMIGGSIGSTAGGIKQYRIIMFFKSIYWNFLDRITNKKVIRTHYMNKVGKKLSVDENELMNNYNFIGMYLLILLIGTLIIASFGFSLSDSMFEFASALGTVGLSVGITSYLAHPIVLWTLTCGMFLGRLEIYIVFIAMIKFSSILTKRKM